MKIREGKEREGEGGTERRETVAEHQRGKGRGERAFEAFFPLQFQKRVFKFNPFIYFYF